MNVPVRRTKTYIAFDGDEDLMSYRTIQSWSADDTISFSLNDAHDLNFARDDSLPESIIDQLRPRLHASKHLVLIVSGATSRNRKGILRYELEYALRNGLPIILVFKGFSVQQANLDDLWDTLWPLIPEAIRNYPATNYCIVCPFTQLAVCSAIESYSHISLPETKTGYLWWWK